MFIWSKEQNCKYLKRKKIKGKEISCRCKLVVSVLDTTLLCAIYGAIVENTLFEDDDAANIFCTFNPTQVFLHLKKKLLLSCYGARAIC